MKIETNAERLKLADEFLTDLYVMGDGEGLHAQSIEVVTWLIEQAERAQELEGEKAENVRLRKALEQVLELSKHDCQSRYLDKCYVVARQALGESHAQT